MLKPNDKILSELLIKKNLITDVEFQKYLTESQSSPITLSEFVVRLGRVSEAQILKTVAENFQIPVVDLKKTPIEKNVLEKIPVKFAWYYRFMPIRIDNKTLTLAVCVPLDVKVQDEIRVYLGYEPKIVLAGESDIVESLKRHYGLAAETIDRIMTREPIDRTKDDDRDEKKVEEIEEKGEDASVIKLVNQIMLEAYKKRATDIHIEPYRNKVRFRYRIDGVLVDANLPADIKHFLQPILSRIKIMSNLSIVERRLPQDGSAVVRTKDQTLDLRVSTIPTPRGESMVIRILPTKVMLFSLEKLGLTDEHVRTFRELIKKPHGIIFVTGPTGSGKTTTLYACLNEINSQERKIITIEDPVEYEMEDITQIQVNPKVNLHFATGLRSILRHDPDIIMVGEVRDLETAEIAIRTALTGHLVFSTLHTNDAASGVTRLIEMGLEPYLVSSSIEAFVAQRLVRVICPHCKEEMSAPSMELQKEIMAALKISDPAKVKIYQGRGCEECNHTGYFGRTAIHEILVMNDAIRVSILEKPRADLIKQMAMNQGMITLRQDGFRKVLEGITTPAEVMNVTAKEDYSLKPETSRPVTSDVLTATSSPAKDRLRVISREILSTKNDYDSRAYVRTNAKLRIRYKIYQDEISDPHTLTLKEGDVEHSTLTKNLSAGGLQFVSSYSLSVGTIVDIKIKLDDSTNTIECLARICRVEEDDQTGLYNLSAYFLDIVSADRVQLSEFVKAKEQELKKAS